MDNLAVILAGGKGTRMKTEKPKVLNEVLFKPLLGWVMDSCKAAGISPENTCIVTGYKSELTQTYINERGEGHKMVFQEEQNGTGHAVMTARSFLENKTSGNVLILCGDAPFMDSNTIKQSLDSHLAKKSAATVITAILDEPKKYGRIIRDGNNFVKITEFKDATEKEKEIKEISSGVFWFNISSLLNALPHLSKDNAAGEYYLPDVLEYIVNNGEDVNVFQTENKNIILGANDRSELLRLNQIACKYIIGKHLDNGVEFVSADGVLISPDVEIDAETVIMPGTVLKGNTKIGKNCTLGPNTLIDSCEIGENSVINASQCYNSRIHNNVKIGPFCHIRPNSEIKSEVKIGDFVEIKNSTIDEKTSVSHLTYIGDSDVGKRVNFGCGCVTVNYDGLSKSRTIVEDDAFIGCNTNLIAPVKVGKGAYTAAGSTITHDVHPGALAIARSRQVTKNGFADKKMKRETDGAER